ncbi:matrix metalloproteinase-21-like [Branchiostoma lanceolatum]|uniref:matrix metalloproteinase-21-like n=1 Tax=Branchiostoma lanceolatum TaxID=7740 RepID=UPI00345487E7
MNVIRISRLSLPRPNFTTTVACLLRHVYAFVTLLLLVSEADRVPGGRGSTHTMHGMVNNQPVRSMGDAASYLRRLGWFNPVDWEPQIEQSAQDGEPFFEPADIAPDHYSDFLDPTLMVEEVEGMGRDGEPTEPVDESISIEELAVAISKFQEENNLTVTGELDEETLSKMNEPRCGNPDKTLAKNHTTLSRLLTHRGNTSSNDSANAAEEPSAGNERRRRSVLEKWQERQQHRTKDKRGYFTGDCITWRLMQEGYSSQSQLDPDMQTAAVDRAFRMWSEVIKPKFREDRHTLPVDEVDILIAFGRDRSNGAGPNGRHLHLGCSHEFQGQEFAHAFSSQIASVHLNDDVYFTVDGLQGISLLRVAVHEIAHALGLVHQTSPPNSVMLANYPTDSPNFEIGVEDRRAIQNLGYGKCEEQFSTVFDWVRPKRNKDGYRIPGIAYNTYFFWNGRYSMYENSQRRTRYGDPRVTRGGWRGITARHIDGIVHVWKRYWDVLFFFAGDSYWEYDSQEDQIYTHDANGNPYPNLIRYGFPGIPDNIDTVYFNRTTGYTYFFKDHLVYQYEIERQRVSPGFPKEISEVFPGVPNNLDAAYYSYTHQTTFFLKGFEYWGIHGNNGPILGPMKTNEQWIDICDVWMWDLDG